MECFRWLWAEPEARCSEIFIEVLQVTPRVILKTSKLLPAAFWKPLSGFFPRPSGLFVRVHSRQDRSAARLARPSQRFWLRHGAVVDEHERRRRCKPAATEFVLQLLRVSGVGCDVCLAGQGNIQRGWGFTAGGLCACVAKAAMIQCCPECLQARHRPRVFLRVLLQT